MAVIGFIVLTLEVSKEGRAFVSRCVELGTASCGDTFDEALANVKEATLEYLNTIERLGERVRVLEEKGLTIRKTRPRSVTLEEYKLHSDEYVGPYVMRVPVSA